MARYAILVIDMLKEFVYGKLSCESAKNVIPKIKSLLDEARESGVPVIYCNDAHIPGVDKELELWGEHAIIGSPEAEVVDELKPMDRDFVVKKRRYSGFFETGLDLLLRELNVDSLVLTGIHTHICVQHTAADAFYRGYRLVIVKDCTAALTHEDHERAIEYMRKIYGADVVSADEAKNMFKGSCLNKVKSKEG